MRYFSDEKLAEMREMAKNDFDESGRSMYLAYIEKIEMLDKRNDKYGDAREELLTAIAELEKVSESYVHRGKADPDDEDNDAFEYENYNYDKGISD